MNKKILMIGVVLLAICLSVSAVSAWEWNFSSSSSSNTNGGDMSFENGVLKLQGVEFKIPDGYKENEKIQKLGEDAADTENAKYSVCEFDNGNKTITTKVFFFSNDDKFKSVDVVDGSENKTMAGIQGVYFPDLYNDTTPTFKYVKDGKLVEVNAPDDATLESILKK